MDVTIEWTAEDEAKVVALKEKAEARGKLFDDAQAGLKTATEFLETHRDALADLSGRLAGEESIKLSELDSELIQNAVAAHLLKMAVDDMYDTVARDRYMKNGYMDGHAIFRGRPW